MLPVTELLAGDGKATSPSLVVVETVVYAESRREVRASAAAPTDY
jgi:hypothetical protein